MRIMVFDVPAESGGALSVLNVFYDKYKADLNNEYIFIVSKPDIQETNNIKVLRFPWIKYSWIHRLFFDHFVAPKLIKKFKVDEVLSLQNIVIPHTQIPQNLYIHNALPLAEYRFSIFDDKLLWLYQNILSRSIFKSIKKANRVIVQTKWMKKALINKLNIDSKKIKIFPPQVDIEVKKRFVENRESLSTFFYPASGMIFKNHKIIIDACINLKEQGINDYSVIFTLKGDENEHISQLGKKVKEHELPIQFIGSLSRETVFDYYSRSVLVFPSYIETVGLPLIEARMHGAPILVSDCIYSHEILDSYAKAFFFNPFLMYELSIKMNESISLGGGIS